MDTQGGKDVKNTISDFQIPLILRTNELQRFQVHHHAEFH